MSMSKFYKCIEAKKANQSQSREIIYRVLIETVECLTVAQVIERAMQLYPKKMSLNTVYRHLHFFVDCKLAVVIQNDDKKAYYCVKEEKSMAFSICSSCAHVERLDINSDLLCDGLNDVEFITVHKACIMCA